MDLLTLKTFEAYQKVNASTPIGTRVMNLLSHDTCRFGVINGHHNSCTFGVIVGHHKTGAFSGSLDVQYDCDDGVTVCVEPNTLLVVPGQVSVPWPANTYRVKLIAPATAYFTTVVVASDAEDAVRIAKIQADEEVFVLENWEDPNDSVVTVLSEIVD